MGRKPIIRNPEYLLILSSIMQLEKSNVQPTYRRVANHVDSMLGEKKYSTDSKGVANMRTRVSKLTTHIPGVGLGYAIVDSQPMETGAVGRNPSVLSINWKEFTDLFLNEYVFNFRSASEYRKGIRGRDEQINEADRKGLLKIQSSLRNYVEGILLIPFQLLLISSNENSREALRESISLMYDDKVVPSYFCDIVKLCTTQYVSFEDYYCDECESPVEPGGTCSSCDSMTLIGIFNEEKLLDYFENFDVIDFATSLKENTALEDILIGARNEFAVGRIYEGRDSIGLTGHSVDELEDPTPDRFWKEVEIASFRRVRDSLQRNPFIQLGSEFGLYSGLNLYKDPREPFKNQKSSWVERIGKIFSEF